jgi:flagellum-specific peptidoglycan hydrolase FlgJ
MIKDSYDTELSSSTGLERELINRAIQGYQPLPVGEFSSFMPQIPQLIQQMPQEPQVRVPFRMPQLQQPQQEEVIPMETIERPIAQPIKYKGKKEFIDAMLPYATAAGKRLNVDPYMIIAQSALETGWGKHAPNFNYFGIKGKGGVQSTKEFLNGKWVTVNSAFKGYKNMEDSVNGYADFIIKNPRYAKALQAKDAYAYLQAIKDAGYATDPTYVDKVSGIYRTIKV